MPMKISTLLLGLLLFIGISLGMTITLVSFGIEETTGPQLLTVSALWLIPGYVSAVRAGEAGILYGLLANILGVVGAIFSLSPFMGGHMLLKALELVILGGIGSVGGIFFAGLVIGTLDATLPLFIGGAASEAIGVGVIITVLLFRPQGFFGREAG